jgi:hypothetical protein
MGFSEAMVPGSLGKLCGKYSPLLGMAFDQAVNSRRLPSDSLGVRHIGLALNVPLTR